MDEPFEIHRRVALYAAIGVAAAALAAWYAWYAWSGQTLAWVIAAILAVISVAHLWWVPDARTPLFVADDHGVRLREDGQWVGLLWREMDEIRVERREGWRHDPRVKVITRDGGHIYTAPVGFTTNVSASRAETELARRRTPVSY